MRLRANFLCLFVILLITSSNVFAQCYDEDLIELGICSLLLQPVCGCNGVTYSNACVAEKFNGISSYTMGACPTQYTSAVNQNLIYLGYVSTSGGSEGAVLAEDRDLFTVAAEDMSAELTISENLGTGGITKAIMNPQGLTFQEPLGIAGGAPVNVASFEKVGDQHRLLMTKDDLQKSLSITPLSLNYTNAGDSENSFNIDFENNKMSIGGLDIVNMGNDNFGLEGDLVQSVYANYDIGNNVPGEHWDEIVANTFVVFSDRRLKNNIKTLEYGLSTVMNLNPVQYKYNTSVDISGKERLGFIAQDVQKIVPQVVIDSDMEITEDKKSYKKVQREHLSMSYQDLIPVLTKAIQEQQAQIELLTSELASVKQALVDK